MRNRVEIVPLSAEIAETITTIDGGNGWKSDAVSWAYKLAAQRRGARDTFVLLLDGMPVGYASIVWQSDYAYFAEHGIPEINDLSVSAEFRERGFGRKIITYLEQHVAKSGRKQVGLGVGLYVDYGAAQRLYAKMGYIPDGLGISYADEPVVPGSSIPIDDEACLYLTKDLPPL